MFKALIAVCLFTSSLSFAGGMKACKADFEKLCSGLTEKREKRKCLKEKSSEVSAECKTALEKRKNKMMKAIEACESDVDTHCGGVEEGRGRIMKCLRDNEEKLSAQCKEQLERKKGKKK